MRYEVEGKLFVEEKNAKEYESKLRKKREEKEQLEKEKNEKFKEFKELEKSYIKMANELYKTYGEIEINLKDLPMYHKSFWFENSIFGL